MTLTGIKDLDNIIYKYLHNMQLSEVEKELKKKMKLYEWGLDNGCDCIDGASFKDVVYHARHEKMMIKWDKEEERRRIREERDERINREYNKMKEEYKQELENWYEDEELNKNYKWREVDIHYTGYLQDEPLNSSYLVPRIPFDERFKPEF